MHFHYKSMVDNDMPGAWPVWTPGFIKRSTIHCSTQNMKALCHVVSETKIFSCIFHYKPMSDNDAPRGGACMDPRGTVSRNYKADNYTLLHTKYESPGPVVSEKKIFYDFPMTPQRWGLYRSQGHGCQDL